jgi:DNA-binding MarR family transcriptional regulator
MSNVGTQREDTTLLFDLWVVANSTRALLDHALHSTGLTAEEFALYSAIRRSVGGVTPSQLAEIMGLAPTTISSVVSRLESRDHICRVPNPKDARSYRVELTAEGRAAHLAAGNIFMPILQAVEAHLGQSTEEVRDALGALRAAIGAAGDMSG